MRVRPEWDRLRGTLRRWVIAARRFFNYQHVAALMMLIIGTSLSSRTSTALDEALDEANIYYTAQNMKASAGVLIGRAKPTWVFRLATLPLVVYGLILFWYSLNHPSTGYTGAAYGIGIWVILQIVATEPERGTRHDGTHGTS